MIPNPKTATAPRETSRLPTISTALSAMAGLLLLGLLIFLTVTENRTVEQSREEGGVVMVETPLRREVEAAGTPIGVIQEYTFSLSQLPAPDAHLAFYTVHQYVTVFIGGQQVYSLKPSGAQRIQTIGSNWIMIPLCPEDMGKEIRVEITPVYEPFRNRQVEFLIGSRLEIYGDRLAQDFPQLALGAMAVVVGFAFLCIAVYRLVRKRGSEGLASLGLFSIMMGLWRLTDTRFTPFLVPEKPILLFYISVGMLMIGIVPLIRSVQWRFHPASRRILDWCCVGASVICIVELLLQVFWGVDLREILWVVHTTIAVGAVIVIGNMIYDWLKYPQNPESILNNRASLILVVGVLGDIAAFYGRGNSSGLLFSLLAMLISILVAGIQKMKRYGEQEKRLAEQNRILAQQERELTESRIATMMSQIRPHFIYNTLGSIEQLCELQPETAAKLVHDLACYLRGNLGEMDNPAPIRLSQELEHVRHYANIEKIRFPDMEIRFDIHSDDFLLPALTIQPLVENAIKHGLMKLPHGGRVTVSSYEEDADYCVCVEDNGVGFDAAAVLDDRTHIGLRNICGRVEIMCDGTMTVESTPGVGTKVRIAIPKKVKQ